MQKRIYLDYASSTPLDERVKKEMEPYWNGSFGNPGSIHQEGRNAKEVVENSRKEIASLLEVSSNEIIFTSGGTEANSLAVIGHLNYLDDTDSLNKTHIITSLIEHPSVLDIFKKYQKRGLKVDFLKVKKDGIIDLDNLKEILKPETKMVSIMYVNNEIGTIQPLREASKIIKKNNTKTIFHTDASQAPLLLEIKPYSLGVDMMTIDAQKMYGPKGVGFLYKNKEANISQVLIGGNQEMGYRPGTENVPLIVGLASSLKYAVQEREKLNKKFSDLQEYLISEIEKRIPEAKLNGSREKRIPNNINVIIAGHDSERAVVELDQRGFACSTKSACLRNKMEGSYVIEALSGKAESGLRFTLGRETGREDLEELLNALEEITR